MATFRTMGGRTITVNERKFPALVERLRQEMLTQPRTNKEYMERVAAVVGAMYGCDIPTATEREFILALQGVGVVERVE